MTVIWITGLPGVGKTAAAEEVAIRLRARGMLCVVLDGDALRAALSPLGAGYDLDSRRGLAEIYSNIAQLLCGQGLHVIVATVSLFAATHESNRRRFPHYVEVLLTCDATLRSRRRPAAISQWPGRDIDVEFPLDPHLTIDTGLCGVNELAAGIVELALATAEDGPGHVAFQSR